MRSLLFRDETEINVNFNDDLAIELDKCAIPIIEEEIDFDEELSKLFFIKKIRWTQERSKYQYRQCMAISDGYDEK